MPAQKANLTLIQGGIVDAVPPPKGMPEDQVADWNTITSTMAANGTLNEASLLNVRAYCEALASIRDCADEIAREGRFIKNKDGIPRAHPAMSIMQKQQELANRFAGEFGLTPKSQGGKPSGDGGKSPGGIDDFL